MKGLVNIQETYEKYKDFLHDVEWQAEYIETDNQTMQDLKLFATTKINNIKHEQSEPADYLIPVGFEMGGAAILASNIWDDEDIEKALMANLLHFFKKNNVYQSYDTAAIRMSRINEVEVYTMTVFIKKGNIKLFK